MKGILSHDQALAGVLLWYASLSVLFGNIKVLARSGTLWF